MQPLGQRLGFRPQTEGGEAAGRSATLWRGAKRIDGNHDKLEVRYNDINVLFIEHVNLHLSYRWRFGKDMRCTTTTNYLCARGRFSFHEGFRVRIMLNDRLMWRVSEGLSDCPHP